MKTLNFLFVLAVFLMAVSNVSATYYIIKTFENYSSSSTEGSEGQLTQDGLKRVDCFTSLIGTKIKQPQAIFYKSDGVDKNGNVKINSRKYTAEAIAAKLPNVSVDAMLGGETNLATIKDTLEANGIVDALFVWTDKDKASKLASALGAANAPAEFKKSNYGLIWAIEGTQLSELMMDCTDVANVDKVKEEEEKKKKSGAVGVRASIMTLAVAIMASAYLLL